MKHGSRRVVEKAYPNSMLEANQKKLDSNIHRRSFFSAMIEPIVLLLLGRHETRGLLLLDHRTLVEVWLHF